MLDLKKDRQLDLFNAPPGSVFVMTRQVGSGSKYNSFGSATLFDTKKDCFIMLISFSFYLFNKDSGYIT